MLEEIKKNIEWFHDNAKSNNIEGLIHVRSRLSTQSYYLAEMAGEAVKGYHEVYYLRKTNFFRAKKNAIDEGKGVGVSETIAEGKIVDYRQREATMEGLKDQYRILLNQINEVLNAMASHINYLKSERTNVKNET